MANGGALRYGYVSTGLGEHRLDDALALLAGEGYDGIALSLDHVHFDPLAPRLRARAERLGAVLDGLGLTAVVEINARYALDPRREHFPTLLSEGRQRRLELVRRAIDVAAGIGAPVVSLRSGAAPPGLDPVTAWTRLMDGCERLLASAHRRGVQLALEPEEGMLVERLEDFEALTRRLGEPPGLGVTLDLGHCAAIEPQPVEDCIRRSGDRLAHVHASDIRRGGAAQVMLGDGELDLRAALRALADAHYGGLVAVELPALAHSAPAAAAEAMARLRSAERAEALA